jgi:multiple sugar transport system substrate-binding protein
MKKVMCVFLSIMLILGMSACGAEKQEETAQEGFKPSMDTSVKASIKIAGGYDNFEALEAEIDRFNEYYPNVELVYTKVDDYNNMIGTVLSGNDAPDIYVNYSWMYGRDQYKASIDYAENLADPALGLSLDVIRSNILLNTDDGTLPMVPVFSNTYGMLVNQSIFEKEGLSVPTTYDELIKACDTLLFNLKPNLTPLLIRGSLFNESNSVFISS